MDYDHIQLLIDSIDAYNPDSGEWYLLLYFPEDDEREEDYYFAILSTYLKPDEEQLETIYWHARKTVGNVIYAAECRIMTKRDAISYLTLLQDQYD